MTRRMRLDVIPMGCGRWAVAGLRDLDGHADIAQGSCRRPVHLMIRVERAMLQRNGEPQSNMKNSHNSHSSRTTRRGPWHAKNIRLLRAALRVWELRQRAAGR